MNRERMAEGYRKRAERDAAIAEEMATVSLEANDELGDVPEY